MPRSALQHRHVREALAIARMYSDNRMENVIGIANRVAPHAQLYGWGCNVAKHKDETGFVYLLPLLLRRSWMYVNKRRMVLARGDVVRLNDFALHWTVDSGPVVCLLSGVHKVPNDGLAIQQLEHGISFLEQGLYDAPRVSEGFRVPGQDECYAMASVSDGDPTLMLTHVAQKERLFIVPCSSCDNPAKIMDTLFPYHWENNRCQDHLK